MSDQPEERQEELLGRTLARLDHQPPGVWHRQEYVARRIAEVGGPNTTRSPVAEGLTVDSLREELAEEFEPVPSLSERQVRARYIAPVTRAWRLSEAALETEKHDPEELPEGFLEEVGTPADRIRKAFQSYPESSHPEGTLERVLAVYRLCAREGWGLSPEEVRERVEEELPEDVPEPDAVNLTAYKAKYIRPARSHVRMWCDRVDAKLEELDQQERSEAMREAAATGKLGGKRDPESLRAARGGTDAQRSAFSGQDGQERTGTEDQPGLFG